MFYNSIYLMKPRIVPSLDDGFRPAVLWNRTFLDAVRSSGEELPLVVGLEQNDGGASIFKTHIFPPEHKLASTNLLYVERMASRWTQANYSRTR